VGMGNMRLVRLG